MTAMTATAKTYLSPAEFAALSPLSESTVRRRIKDGSIPTFQPGGPGTRILIPRDALERSTLPIEKPTDQTVNCESIVRPSETKVGGNAARSVIPGPSPKWTRPTLDKFDVQRTYDAKEN